METLTAVQIRDFLIVLLALLAFIILAGNAWKTWKNWKKPQDDLASWQRSVDVKLSSDNERLKNMESGNRVICRGILALLSHEINGNSDEKLKASQQEITDYLIDR